MLQFLKKEKKKILSFLLKEGSIRLQLIIIISRNDCRRTKGRESRPSVNRNRNRNAKCFALSANRLRLTPSEQEGGYIYERKRVTNEGRSWSRKESWPDFMVSRQVGELPETNRPTFTPTHVLSFSPLTIPGPRIFDRYSCTAIPLL